MRRYGYVRLGAAIMGPGAGASNQSTFRVANVPGVRPEHTNMPRDQMVESITLHDDGVLELVRVGAKRHTHVSNLVDGEPIEAHADALEATANASPQAKKAKTGT